MKHMISQIRPGSTNESFFGIITRKYIILTHLYRKTSIALHTLYDFLCLNPHCIAFQNSFVSASDLNRFLRFCKSYVVSMR